MKSNSFFLGASALTLLFIAAFWVWQGSGDTTGGLPPNQPEARRPASGKPSFKSGKSTQVASVRHQMPPPAGPGNLSELTVQIRKALVSNDESLVSEALEQLLPELVAGDPTAAARLAGELELGVLRDTLLRRIAQLWANRDLNTMMSWANSLDDATERESALANGCFQSAQADPAQAAALALKYEFLNRPDVMENIVHQWAGRDPTAAVAWATTHGTSESQPRLLARAAFGLAQSDPLAAATLVASQIPAGQFQDEAAMSVLHQWALRDPTAAAQWAYAFPECPLRERALQELAGLAQYRSAMILPDASPR